MGLLLPFFILYYIIYGPIEFGTYVFEVLSDKLAEIFELFGNNPIV